jgi:hypothetical protein
MVMWNWLEENYKNGSITLGGLIDAMGHRNIALALWQKFLEDDDLVEIIREEVEPFLIHLKKTGKINEE